MKTAEWIGRLIAGVVLLLFMATSCATTPAPRGPMTDGEPVQIDDQRMMYYFQGEKQVELDSLSSTLRRYEEPRPWVEKYEKQQRTANIFGGIAGVFSVVNLISLLSGGYGVSIAGAVIWVTCGIISIPISNNAAESLDEGVTVYNTDIVGVTP